MQRETVDSTNPARGPAHWKRNALAAAVAAALSGMAQGNPTAPVVVNGAANFATSGSTLTVTNTPGTIINWKGFSINTNETTRFVQQSAQSQVLNRVTGGDPSQILGTLGSNGRVFLINPNGIAFGAGAKVDVAGLVASSLNLSNEDFLAGRLNFTDTPGAGKVTNAGEIRTASGGSILLIAPTVENHGVLIAADGTVTLAAGKTVLLVDPSSPDIQVELTAPANEALNVGSILANRVSLFGGIVTHSGSIEATRASIGADGTVTLKATDTTLVSGTITAPGGQIDVLGNQVGLLAGAILEASSASKGGTIHIGGGGGGTDPTLKNAQAVYIDANAQVHADATDNGDGGHITVWSEQATRVYGQLTARGGPNGGNGGFIETSGKQYLEITSTPDASAPNGQAGNWLIDPFNNITIQATGSDTNVSGSSSNPNFTTTNDGAIVTTTSIQTALNAGTSVSITTGSAGTPTQAGDITVSSAIQKSTGGNANLILSAANNININAGITSTSGALNLTLNANTNTAGGTSNLSSVLGLNGGTLALSGGNLNLITGSQIQNAFITSSAPLTVGLTVPVANATTLSNVTLGANLTANLGATVTVPDTLTLSNATVSLLSGYQCCAYYDTSLNFTGNNTTPTLSGTGTVLLSSNNNMAYGYASYVRPTTAGATLTIAPGITIHGGGGQVGNATLGLINNGTINADAAGQTITVTGTNWSNGSTSVLESTAGTLSLQGSWSNPLGNTIISTGTTSALTLGGTWSNAGTISATAGTLNWGGTFTNTGLVSFSNTTTNLTVPVSSAQLSGGSISRTGGTVNLSSTWDNTNTVYDLAAAGSIGSVNLLTGSQITGGTITSSAPLTVGLTVPVANATTLSNVTLGANLTANLGATVTVPDTLTLSNATVSLLSGYQCCAYYDTSLNFTGNNTTPTLSGTGTVLLSSNNNMAYGYASYVRPTTAGATLTIAPGITIHGGGGQVGNATLGLINNGTINADAAGQTITVTGTNWSNGSTSVLESTAGTLSLQGSWSNPLGNTIISTGTTSALTLGGTWSNAGTISATAGTLNWGGTFTNTGLVSFSNTTTNLTVPVSSAQLSGGSISRTGGTVNLSSTWDNTNTVYDLAAAGSIGSVNLLTGSQITGGTITSSAPLTVGLTVPVANATTLSNVTLGANLTANLGATVTVPDTLTLSNATVSLLSGYQCCAYYDTSLNFTGNNTTPTLSGTGTVLLSSNNNMAYGYASYVRPTTAGATLTIAPGITIHGGGGQVGNATLGLINNGTINADAAGQTITVTGTNWSNGSTSVLESTAGTLSLQGSWSNPLGNTIISTGTTSALTLGGTWSNAGTISATAGTLNWGGTFTNTGLVSFSNTTTNLTVPVSSAQLSGGSISRTGGTVNLSSTWDNTNTVYDLAAAGSIGSVNLLTGSQITGGTITSSAPLTVGLTVPVANATTLSNVTLGANLTANLGATVTVPDTLTLSNATVSLLSGYQCCAYYDTSLNFTGNNTTPTLSGTGTVLLSSNNNMAYGYASYVRPTTAGATLTIAPGITIHGGGGQVGNATLGLINNGTINADAAGQTITVTGTNWSNGGLIESTGGTINLTSASTTWINSSTGVIDARSGIVSFSKFLANDGVLEVLQGATLTTNNADLTNNATGIIRGTGTFDLGVVSGTTILHILTNNGTLDPGVGVGGVGTLTIKGNLVDSTTSDLHIDLGGTTTGSYDHLSVIGATVGTTAVAATATLAGTLNVGENGLLNGVASNFYAAKGNSFPNLVTVNGGTNGLSGGFTASGVNLPAGALAGDVAFTVTTSGVPSITNTTASITRVVASGDWGSPGTWTRGVPTANTDAILNGSGATVTVSTAVTTPSSVVLGDALTVASGGSLTLPTATTNASGGSSLDQLITVAGSLTLPASISGISGALNLAGGTLTNSGALLLSGVATSTGGTWNGSGGITLPAASGSGNAIVPPGSLTVSAGTLTINEPVSNAGVIGVSASTLAINGSFTNSGTVGLTNGGVLNLLGTSNSSSGTLTFGASTQDSATLSGVLNSSGLLVFTGTSTLASGTQLTVTGSGVAAAGSLTLNTGATFTDATATPLTFTGAVNNNGLFNVNAGSASLLGGGTSSGTFSVAAGATLNFGNSMTASTVNTTLNAATLNVSSGGTLTFGGGNTTLGSNTTISGAGSIQYTGGSLSNNASASLPLLVAQGTTLTLTNQSLLGTGSLTVNGILDVTNSTVQNTLANNATGVINANGTNLFSATAPATNAGVLNVQSGNTTFNAGLTQTSGATVLGGGVSPATLTIGGTGLQVAGGTLGGTGIVGGNVSIGSATLSAGTATVPGQLTINGNLSLGSTSTTSIKIQSPGLLAGTDYDQIVVTGTATLGGTFTATMLNGYAPSANQTYTAMTWSGYNGAFNTVSLPSGMTAAALSPNSKGFGLDYTFTAACVGGTICFTNVDNNGLWTDLNNWNTGVLPGSTDAVVLSATGNPTVSLASITGAPLSYSIASIAGSNALTIGAATTLNVTGTSNLSGLLTVAGGSLNLGGAATLGNVALNSGNINAAGNFTATNLAINTGTATLNGLSSLQNLSFTSAGTLNGSGALTVANSYSNSGGSLGTTFGSVSITQASGDLTLNTSLGASGTVTLSAPGGAITNANGTITGANIVLSAANGIGNGSGGAFLVDPPTLTATNTTTGDINIADATGPMTAATITNSGSGNIILASAGDLTLGSVSGLGNVTLQSNTGSILGRTTGTNLVTTSGATGLITLAAANSIGSATQDINLNPGTGTVSVAAAAGNIFVAQTTRQAVASHYSLNAPTAGSIISATALGSGGILIDGINTPAGNTSNYILSATAPGANITFAPVVPSTFGAASLTLKPAGATVFQSGNVTINAAFDSSSAPTNFSGASVSFTTAPVLGTVNLSAGSLGTAQALALNGPLTWTGGTLGGPGIVTLNGTSNTVSGSVGFGGQITNTGTVSFSNVTASDASANGSAFFFNDGAATLTGGNFAVPIYNRAGTMTVNNATVGVLNNSNLLTVSGSNSADTFAWYAGTISGTGTFVATNGIIGLGGGSNATMTLNGATLNDLSSGGIGIGGTNFTGTLNINSGQLQTAAVNLGTGGALNFSGNGLVVGAVTNGVRASNGTITNNGGSLGATNATLLAAVNNAAGTVTLTNSTLGGTVINTGIANLSGDTITGSYTNNGTTNLIGTTTVATSGNFTDSPGTGGALVFATGAGLNIAGTATFNSDTLGGTVNNNNGTVNLNSTTLAGTYNDPGTTNINGTVTVNGSFNANSGTITLNDSTLIANGSFNWNGGTIGGIGSVQINSGATLGLTGSGNRTLNGVGLNDLNGNTTLGAGTLTIDSGASLAANNLTIASGATLALPNTGGVRGVLSVPVTTAGPSGVINVNGILSVGNAPPTGTIATGGGIVTTDTINVNGTGATLIANGGDGSINAVALNLLNGGTLKGSGIVGLSTSGFGALAVNNTSGFVSPGNSPGILTVNGTYAQGNAGTLVVQIQGTTTGNFDQLIVRDTASLSGALQVNVLPGYQPSVGQSFQVVDVTGTARITGAFANTSISQGGITFVNNYQPSFLTLDLTSFVPPTVPTPLQISANAFLVALDMVAQPGEVVSSSASGSSNLSTSNETSAQDLAAQLQATLPGCLQ